MEEAQLKSYQNPLPTTTPTSQTRPLLSHAHISATPNFQLRPLLNHANISHTHISAMPIYQSCPLLSHAHHSVPPTYQSCPPLIPTHFSVMPTCQRRPPLSQAHLHFSFSSFVIPYSIYTIPFPSFLFPHFIHTFLKRILEFDEANRRKVPPPQREELRATLAEIACTGSHFFSYVLPFETQLTNKILISDTVQDGYQVNLDVSRLIITHTCCLLPSQFPNVAQFASHMAIQDYRTGYKNNMRGGAYFVCDLLEFPSRLPKNVS